MTKRALHTRAALPMSLYMHLTVHRDNILSAYSCALIVVADCLSLLLEMGLTRKATVYAERVHVRLHLQLVIKIVLDYTYL